VEDHSVVVVAEEAVDAEEEEVVEGSKDQWDLQVESFQRQSSHIRVET